MLLEISIFTTNSISFIFLVGIIFYTRDLHTIVFWGKVCDSSCFAFIFKISIRAGTATLPKNLKSPPVFHGVRVARSLVFCVLFCRSLFVLILLAIVLSVLLRFENSDYPFGVFKIFLDRKTDELLNLLVYSGKYFFYITNAILSLLLIQQIKSS